MKSKKWKRLRFHANADDYRPVIWPPLGPYWCSGWGDDYSIVVAYFPNDSTDEDIKRFWPEANNIDITHEDCELSFSGRFPKPDWWKD